ncbi:ABC transporter ATP-binding protein [Phorcysia thermohydrogeniphila]|uniref:Iron complex transport system ATP-binding protein n=1 Tax=Phorcysia thermohydrogeniphila TaxID=936138 RepID=A0A4R1GJV2_9BACT|nr:ABC transporter ATP-binding protein [Phorcysia thermohydrogeniphila]TCK04552.1 iron complex transport system ATP-binding protein [Phorcysia thermohydrogeniphila]
MLEVKNLSFKDILRGITFSVESATVVGLAGKNGAGKTTLLKCLGGYYHYSGRINWNGREIGNLPLKQRIKLVNYLPQSIEVLFPFTVEELLTASIPFRVEREALEGALQRVGILHLRSRAFRLLSGGEKVKVFIARLLLIDPEIYLFDEPAAFLDVEVLPLLAEIILELKERGKIVLVTAHDVNFLLDVCDVFLGLKGGELLFYGDRETFLKNLENLYDTKLRVVHVSGETFIKPLLRR